MAKYRPPEYCIKCGKQLKGVYKDQSKVPFMQKIIGDTFIRYAECDCIKGNKDYDKSKKAHGEVVPIPNRIARILAEKCYDEKVPKFVKDVIDKESFILGYCENPAASGGEDKQDELWAEVVDEVFCDYPEYYVEPENILDELKSKYIIQKRKP